MQGQAVAATCGQAMSQPRVVRPRHSHAWSLHRAATRGHSTGQPRVVTPQGSHVWSLHRAATRGHSTGQPRVVTQQGNHARSGCRSHMWSGHVAATRGQATPQPRVVTPHGSHMWPGHITAARGRPMGRGIASTHTVLAVIWQFFSQSVIVFYNADIYFNIQWGGGGERAGMGGGG